MFQQVHLYRHVFRVKLGVQVHVDVQVALPVDLNTLVGLDLPVGIMGDRSEGGVVEVEVCVGEEPRDREVGLREFWR